MSKKQSNTQQTNQKNTIEDKSKKVEFPFLENCPVFNSLVFGNAIDDRTIKKNGSTYDFTIYNYKKKTFLLVLEEKSIIWVKQISKKSEISAPKLEKSSIKIFEFNFSLLNLKTDYSNLKFPKNITNSKIRGLIIGCLENDLDVDEEIENKTTQDFSDKETDEQKKEKQSKTLEEEGEEKIQISNEVEEEEIQEKSKKVKSNNKEEKKNELEKNKKNTKKNVIDEKNEKTRKMEDSNEKNTKKKKLDHEKDDIISEKLKKPDKNKKIEEKKKDSSESDPDSSEEKEKKSKKT
jgi:hypothetical protein